MSDIQAQLPIYELPIFEWFGIGQVPLTQIFKFAGEYVVRFPALADFNISSTGLKVTAFPVPGVSRQTIEHLYLNQVLPLALSRQFKLVLHAAAVEIDGFAIAFLGVSGRGKSTLAASFATNRYRFLTDDGLQLEKHGDVFLAEPSHPSIRLWDDSRRAVMPEKTETAQPVDYTPKSRLLAGNEVPHCGAARPLCCMYFLGEGNTDSISIQPVSDRDAMIELVRHSFLLDIEEKEMLQHHFGQLADLSGSCMFFRLDYPRRYESLEEVREQIIRHACAECGQNC